jgi:hypothetical protein
MVRESAHRVQAEPRWWGAAPVGPYGAMLADGSEYCGRYGLISACEPRSL